MAVVTITALSFFAGHIEGAGKGCNCEYKDNFAGIGMNHSVKSVWNLIRGIDDEMQPLRQG